MKTASRFMFVPFTILLVLANTRLLMPSSATTRLPGVTSGQFLHFSVNTTVISGNDTELISAIQQAGERGWMNITVTDVSGVNVTFHELDYGPIRNASIGGILNLESGTLNGTPNYGLPLTVFLAANLSASDPIYVGNAYYLNETVPADYLGQQLETNYLTASRNYTNRPFYGYNANRTEKVQCYWERKTGILLDFLVEVRTNRSDGSGGILMAQVQARILILSAVPSPPLIPEFPSILVLSLFMVAELAAVIVYKKKKRS